MREYAVPGKKVKVTDYGHVRPPFEDACFYAEGESYAKVVGPGGTFYVDVQGEKRIYHEDGRRLTNAEEFRAAFPEGKIPGDDGEDSPWRLENNSWWAVVTSGDPSGEDDEVCDSFEGALATAIERAGGE